MRTLTRREREVLEVMIRRGTTSDVFSDSERDRLLEQLDDYRVWGSCGCSMCPSIDLGDECGEYVAEGSRTILNGFRGDEGLLLFIDDGRPTYLEQYSHSDNRFGEFPHPDEIEFEHFSA